MIGYPISRSDLEARIESFAPGWIKKVSERTKRFEKIGKYDEKSSIWSEVKPVYMNLQGECKCAFCERKMESMKFGKVEQDVEHFRPKGNVRAWKIPKSLKNEKISVTDVPKDNRGYHLLPYHPFNYAAACKPCNSALKKDYFPIAGEYDLEGRDPIDLLREQPYLIYPIGDFDESPENLIRFHGASPQPISSSGRQRERALVTIEFFKLNDVLSRKNLFRERAWVIVALYPQLDKLASGAVGDAKIAAEALVDGFTSSNSAHTNCARRFKELFETNREEASAIFKSAVALVTSIS